MLTQTTNVKILCFAVLALVSSCSGNQQKEKLFNGTDLTGWDTFIASPADSIPIQGLNNDPTHVFSVVTEDGQPAIRVSGEIYGGLSTQKEFENYHLSVQFKWGMFKLPSFKDRKRDSGLLYHAVGPHGVDARSWMRSQELQIQESDCGDYWGVAGASFDVPASRNEKGELVYDPKGSLLTFNAINENGRHCIKNPDAEKPYGEWNTLELYCFGDTAIHIVNGVVVMRLYHSQQIDNGVATVLKKGKIQFQCEGSEIYYRSLDIEPIKEIPASLLN